MLCYFFYLLRSHLLLYFPVSGVWKLEELKSRWIERFLPSSTDSIHFSSRISNFPRHSDHWFEVVFSAFHSSQKKKTIPQSCSTSLSFLTEENPVHIFPGRWLTFLPCAPKVFEEKVVCSRNLGLELSSKHGFYLCGMTCGISWSRNFIDLEEIEANSWDELPKPEETDSKSSPLKGYEAH